MRWCAARQQLVGKPAKAPSWESIPAKCGPVNYHFNSFRCCFRSWGGGRGEGANWGSAYSDKHKTVNVKQRPRTLQRTNCRRPSLNTRDGCWIFLSVFLFVCLFFPMALSVKCNHNLTKYLCPPRCASTPLQF